MQQVAIREPGQLTRAQRLLVAPMIAAYQNRA